MAWVVGQPCSTRSLLHAVQRARLFADSKHFVDMALKPQQTPAQLAAAFEALILPPVEPTARSSDQIEHGTAGQQHLPAPATSPSADDLRALLDKFFDAPGSDMETELDPPDMPCQAEGDGFNVMQVPQVAWLSDLQDSSDGMQMRAFAIAVCGLWRLLYRQVSPRVQVSPHHHTLLPLPHPFIVAGDRFRELYYWDSYWVLRGLLACGMRTTARHILLNMLHLVDHVGHVPNGARVYYTNRSQPPLLSAMVVVVSGLAGRPSSAADLGTTTAPDVDMKLLREALPRLIKTWQYWTTGTKCVHVALSDDGANGNDSITSSVYPMSRYWADWEAPRPESYREDWELAERVVAAATVGGGDSGGSGGSGEGRGNGDGCSSGTSGGGGGSSSCGGRVGASTTSDESLLPNHPAARCLWRELASAAESGWDFSSRWCGHPHDLTTMRTTQVIPVDLNAFVAMTASDIAVIARTVGAHDVADEFTANASERWAALDRLCWCTETSCWQDLLIVNGPTYSDCNTGNNGQRSTGRHQHVAGVSSNPVCGDGAHGDEGHHQNAASVIPVRRTCRALASNWVPLWAGQGEPQCAARAQEAIQGLLNSGLVQPGGVMTSLEHTGQQWDAPNAWPPLQHMLIQGAAACKHMAITGEGAAASGTALARQLAGAFISTTHNAWQRTGHMHEKYDARRVGAVGGGGEYTPQVGFGWTNGVLLDLLSQGYR